MHIVKSACAGLAAVFFATLAPASPASAVTIANGVVLFTHADALAGGVSPGDTPGYPITLSTPGSYRLAGNLAPTAGKDGIVVTAPEVTLDMFGFRMVGGSVAASGISVQQRAFTVRNGTIRSFTVDGIVTTSQFLTVDSMRIYDNGDTGVREVFGSSTTGFATITNSNVSRNTTGISCNNNCRIEGNVIGLNNGYGIYIPYDGAVVLGNTISNNKAYGVYVASKTGLGNNTIIGNTLGVALGSYIALNPNACPTGAC